MVGVKLFSEEAGSRWSLFAKAKTGAIVPLPLEGSFVYGQAGGRSDRTSVIFFNGGLRLDHESVVAVTAAAADPQSQGTCVWHSWTPDQLRRKNDKYLWVCSGQDEYARLDEKQQPIGGGIEPHAAPSAPPPSSTSSGGQGGGREAACLPSPRMVRCAFVLDCTP